MEQQTGQPGQAAGQGTPWRMRSAEIDVPLTMTVPLTRIEDGTLRVTGTRIPIDRIVYAYHEGQTPEQFCQDFPTVSVADVYAVIGYYLQHRELIDTYLRLRERDADEIREAVERKYPTTELRERLVRQRDALGVRTESLR